MKILMMTRSMPRHSKGGMEDHAITLAKGLAKKHKVTVLTTSSDVKHEKIGKLEIIYLSGTKSGEYSNKWWEKSREWFKENQNSYDIVHSQSSAAYSILDIKQIPVIMSLHGTALDEIKTNIRLCKKINPKKWIIASLLYANFKRKHYFRERPHVRKMDAIIATSHEQEKIIKKLYNPKQIFKVFNGIDENIFKPKNSKILKKYNIGNEKIIMFASRLIEQKGAQFIIKAMPFILEKHSNTKLIIIGDGNYRKTLEDLTNKLNIKENVIFTGFVDMKKFASYINACNIFINSTIQQNGYDLTILEAMSCEKPVIVSNIGSVPTAVTEKEGILTKPGNVKEIASSANKILSNNKIADKLGKAGRKRILNLFTVKKMVNDTEKIYQKVIAGVNNENAK